MTTHQKPSSRYAVIRHVRMPDGRLQLLVAGWHRWRWQAVLHVHRMVRYHQDAQIRTLDQMRDWWASRDKNRYGTAA